ncbi:hypothetical protein Tco_1129449 [Tanacetum coccineum]
MPGYAVWSKVHTAYGVKFLRVKRDMLNRELNTKTEPSTPPWSFESLSDSDISDHPPWSSKSMNEKRNKRLSEEFQFRKLLFDIDLTFGLDFSHETLDMKNEIEDPINYQQDPYLGEDEAEENA